MTRPGTSARRFGKPTAPVPAEPRFDPRFFFLGAIIFDRKVFRSHYLALDTILFANSHAADPAIPHHSSVSKFKSGQQKTDDGRIISIKKIDPLALDPGI